VSEHTEEAGGGRCADGVVSVTTTGARLPLRQILISLASTARLLLVKEQSRSIAYLVFRLDA
jgi:hypothetical protein